MNSNEFYRTFIEYYDEFFPTDPGVTEFLGSIRENADATGTPDTGRGGALSTERVSALDLGCGTGGYVRALRESGIEAWGTDLSPEMIARGIELMGSGTAEPDLEDGRNRLDPDPTGKPHHPEKAHHPGKGKILSVGDLRSAKAHPEAPFDLVYSIGNTIAHLSSADEVDEWIGTLPAILYRPHGTVVVQFVDLAHLPVGSGRELPLLGDGASEDGESTNGDPRGERHASDTSHRATMRRRYTRVSPERYRMDATITVTGRGGYPLRETSISQTLLVLETHRMIDAFRSAGFKSVTAYGGFSRERPVRSDSWVRVIEARLS
ncbi:MAG: class I SAM-dependent methyltransferase [Alkalispirochaeta sp.]